MKKIIGPFKEEYNFLSNFYIHNISYNGIIFVSNEHAYQSMKATNYNDMILIASSKTPGQAKRAGNNIIKRPDWDTAKLRIMKDICRIKFKDPILKEKLINTKDSILIEINEWKDDFWGMYYKNGELYGKNNLGKILMEIREENKTKPNVFYKTITRLSNINKKDE